jgi:hypothetical protein
MKHNQKTSISPEGLLEFSDGSRWYQLALASDCNIDGDIYELLNVLNQEIL